MRFPGFTAEGSLPRSGGTVRGRTVAGTGDPAAVITPAGVYVQTGDTIYYCYKCMSGSDEPCCVPVASSAGGSSRSGPAPVLYLSR